MSLRVKGHSDEHFIQKNFFSNSSGVWGGRGELSSQPLSLTKKFLWPSEAQYIRNGKTNNLILYRHLQRH